MYYRVYQINNAIYPGWGYNLNFLELNQMSIWWLNSMFESEMIEKEEFNEKNKVLTNNIELAEKVRKIRQYGWGKKYEVEIENGVNSRLD